MNKETQFDLEMFIYDNVELELSDRHGQYIPKLFHEQFPQANIMSEDWDAIADPENKYYWDAWSSILDTYEYLGRILYQSGDLFSIDWRAVDNLTEEQSEQFWEALCI